MRILCVGGLRRQKDDDVFAQLSAPYYSVLVSLSCTIVNLLSVWISCNTLCYQQEMNDLYPHAFLKSL